MLGPTLPHFFTGPQSTERVPLSFYHAICSLAGCRFRGVQPEFRTPTKCAEAVILFDDPHGSTLGLPQSRFNFENVRQRLAESETEWGHK